MSGLNRAARILVAIGSVVLFASAALHSLAACPRLSNALSASNLNAALQKPLRAGFLLVGWDWIVIAVETVTYDPHTSGQSGDFQRPPH